MVLNLNALQTYRLWLSFCVILGAVWSGHAGTVWAKTATESMVMLDVIDGDSAFLVDENAQKAWWIVGECKRSIPIKKSKSSINKSTNSMTSEIVSKDVELGSRRVELRQQFRFNVSTTPPSLEVFNSMRGGWSSIPVQANESCALDATCRSRMELPEC